MADENLSAALRRGILAPDAPAVYAAMLEAVEKPCPNDPLCEHPESAHDPDAGSPGEPPWCLDCDCGDRNAEGWPR
jgi:hypothetical protein